MYPSSIAFPFILPPFSSTPPSRSILLLIWLGYIGLACDLGRARGEAVAGQGSIEINSLNTDIHVRHEDHGLGIDVHVPH